MPSKIACYLRTHRRNWGLTQKELAGLVPGCRRARVSAVERGMMPPNSTELLAYAFIFGVAPQAIFPRYAEEIVDRVMQGAASMDRQLADDRSALARHKLELLKQLPPRSS